MKRRKKWPWRKIFVVFGLIVCAVWFVAALEALPASFKPPARWGDGIDSAKWFITLADGTMWDSTAGTARTDCARYDTTITGLSNDTAYLVILRMWDGSDSASDWTFYWPVLATAAISGANMAAIADSVDADLTADHGAGSWITGGAGTGSDTIILFALDTSGTDATVQDVKITIFNPSGEDVVTGIYTDPDGKHQLKLDPANNYSAQFRRTGYIFPSHSFNVSGNDDSLPVPGYNIELLASPTPNYCRVQGYVGGASDVVNKATVTFTIQGTIVNNSCDTMFFIPSTVDTTSDTAGFFCKDLMYSSCLNDLQYLVVAVKEGGESKSVLITVPDTASYRIVW